MGENFRSGPEIFSERAYVLQGIYIFGLGDSCSQGDLDVVVRFRMPYCLAA